MERSELELNFRVALQMFLFFLILQFFGPVLILMEILPLNAGLVWPAISVLVASYIVIQKPIVNDLRDILRVTAISWSMIIILNTLNYLFMGLYYSVLTFILSAVHIFLFILSGSFLGKAFYEGTDKN